MPLSRRGREVLQRLPATRFSSGNGSSGCEIVRTEAKCVGCGRCIEACPAGACTRGETLDVGLLLSAPQHTRRGELGAALGKLARRAAEGPVQVPERVKVFRAIVYWPDKCLGCGACARICPSEAIELRPPEVMR
jgi:ferredoxin